MDTAVDIEPPQGVPVSPPWGSFGRNVTLGVVSAGSNFLLRWLNTYKTTNLSTLQDAVRDRPEGRGLLTVCNHTRQGLAHTYLQPCSILRDTGSVASSQALMCLQHPR